MNFDPVTNYVSVLEQSYEYFLMEAERLKEELRRRFPLGAEDMSLISEFMEARNQARGNRRLLMQFFDENGGGCESQIAMNTLAYLILN